GLQQDVVEVDGCLKSTQTNIKLKHQVPNPTKLLLWHVVRCSVWCCLSVIMEVCGSCATDFVHSIYRNWSVRPLSLSVFHIIYIMSYVAVSCLLVSFGFHRCMMARGAWTCGDLAPFTYSCNPCSYTLVHHVSSGGPSRSVWRG
ncbi:unnamed protein product, partial [Pylaiella littoralis]